MWRNKPISTGNEDKKCSAISRAVSTRCWALMPARSELRKRGGGDRNDVDYVSLLAEHVFRTITRSGSKLGKTTTLLTYKSCRVRAIHMLSLNCASAQNCGCQSWPQQWRKGTWIRMSPPGKLNIKTGPPRLTFRCLVYVWFSVVLLAFFGVFQWLRVLVWTSTSGITIIYQLFFWVLATGPPNVVSWPSSAKFFHPGSNPWLRHWITTPSFRFCEIHTGSGFREMQTNIALYFRRQREWFCFRLLTYTF